MEEKVKEEGRLEREKERREEEEKASLDVYRHTLTHTSAVQSKCRK